MSCHIDRLWHMYVLLYIIRASTVDADYGHSTDLGGIAPKNDPNFKFYARPFLIAPHTAAHCHYSCHSIAQANTAPAAIAAATAAALTRLFYPHHLPHPPSHTAFTTTTTGTTTHSVLPPARHTADHRHPSKSAPRLFLPPFTSRLHPFFSSPSSPLQSSLQSPNPLVRCSHIPTFLSLRSCPRSHASLPRSAHPPGDTTSSRSRSSSVWKSTSSSTSSSTPLSTAVPSCFSDQSPPSTFFLPFPFHSQIPLFFFLFLLLPPFLR